MNIKDIKIGDRLRKDLGDIQTLASSIQEIGLLQPIVINQDNELIAGQRRLEACKLLGRTEVSTTIVNLDDIIKGEFHENAVRKGFTLSERVAILQEIEKRRLGHRQRKDSNLESFQRENKDKRSVDIVAKYTGVSQGQLAKEKKIVEMAHGYADVEVEPGVGVHTSGTPPLWMIPRIILDKVDKDIMSVNKAYKKLQHEQKRHELITSAIELQKSSNENQSQSQNIQLFQGDFNDLTKQLSDNSIDLIYVDPFYDEGSLPLYEKLAVAASRILRPGSSIVFNVGHGIIPQVINYFENAGLHYHWILSVKLQGSFPRAFDRKVVIKHKPLLWFRKGDKSKINMVYYIEDFIESKRPDKLTHEWEQSTIEAEHVISRLTVENQIVLDPMMGSGTTGIASKKIKRKFIGIEIDPQRFEIAKANLAP
jgi:16S rRNA G966 N2-methylase RsmD